MKTHLKPLLLPLLLMAALPLPSSAGAGCTAPTSSSALELGGCMAGDSLILRDVKFDTDKATLKPHSIGLLQQVASELKKNPSMKVAIQGHTDAVGGADYNLALSLQRASAVVDFLIGAGVNPAQLESQGLGESQPMADNATAVGRALNRRVELALIGTLKPQVPVAAEPPPPQTVYISTFHAKPSTLTVPVGTEVVWKNYDETSYDITFSDGVKIGRIWTIGNEALPWGGSPASRTFDQPGEYTYQCAVTKAVNGKIIVKPVDEIKVTEAPAFPGHTTSTYKAEQTSKPYNSGGYSAPLQHTSHQHSAPANAAAPATAAAAPVAPSGTAAVSIDRHAFSPERLVVAKGSTVTWTNNEMSRHIVVFGTRQSDALRKGDSFSRVFEQPGEYPYHCGMHKYMTGTVVVEG